MKNITVFKKYIALFMAVLIASAVFYGCEKGGSSDNSQSSSSKIFGVGDSSWNPDFSDKDSQTDSGSYDDPTNNNCPEFLKAFKLSPGADYDISGKSYNQICSEIDTYLDRFESFGFNGIIVDIFCADGKTVFKSEIREYAADFDEDIFDYIYNRAMSLGYFVYAGFGINKFSFADPFISVQPEFEEIIGEFLEKYKYVSGVFFDDYGFEHNESIYADYIKNGSLQGYSNYKTDKVSKFISNSSDIVKNVSNLLFTGVFASSPSYSDKKIIINGNCDALSWINHRFADSTAISADRGISDGFENEIDAFLKETKDSKGKYFISLNPENKDFEEQYGKALKKESDGIIVKNAYAVINGNIVLPNDGDSDGKAKKNSSLKVVSPSSSSKSTYEPTYYFSGSCDPAFPLYINDTPIQTSPEGYFSYNAALTVGTNIFVLKHKNTEKTYKITYKVYIIKDVSPTKDTYYEGGTLLAVRAICLKGALVSAELNGQKIYLEQYNDNPDINTDGESNSNYTTYSGYFSLPEASVKTVSLGKLKFTAQINGKSVSENGGKIYVNSISAPPEQTSPELDVFNSLYGSEGLEDLTPGKKGYIAEIAVPQAETFSADKVDNRSRSINSYLPKGTIDYCGPDIKYNENGATYHYRRLDYGKRVYSLTSTSRGERSDYINIYYGSLPSYNKISVAGTSRSDRHSYIVLNTLWKAPFSVTLAPQEYIGVEKNPSEYKIDEATYEYIDFSFSYCTSASGDIDLRDNKIFSSYEWIKKDDGTYSLRLYLRKKGKFCGWSASYNENGQLVLGFLEPAAISPAQNDFGYSLNGTVIMLDPGHGGEDVGAIGAATSPDFYEASLNMMLSVKIRDILESLGATVIMTRTGNVNVTLDQRNALVRQYKPDIFISVHRNSSVNSEMHGYSAYYYEPYSMHLAKEIGTRCTDLLQSDKPLLNYSPPMQVCRVSDCPSVLTENWYVSNQKDYSNIISSEFNDLTAQKTVEGIIAYFLSMQQN